MIEAMKEAAAFLALLIVIYLGTALFCSLDAECTAFIYPW